MIYKPFDIVVVPFPFTDSNKTKRRPAIVLSSDITFGQYVDHSILAMITSARNQPWKLDTPITNLIDSGLPKPSVIRMKWFTLDHRLIIEKIGTLALEDRITFKKNFNAIFASLIK
ncbi:MAG TPA: type II toxin-antitoxin system PemK/MazF family toxin [Candidatus Babeliales bacterium]|jgi:mRNA interferase MazF|nr:type II toxin-antitoxin system PemK/MazF family toxin [Candidatus Babeliales bacterium]